MIEDKQYMNGHRVPYTKFSFIMSTENPRWPDEFKIHVGPNGKIFKLLLSETTDPSDIKLGIIFF